MVERKKTGQPKARKKNTWVKRAFHRPPAHPRTDFFRFQDKSKLVLEVLYRWRSVVGGVSAYCSQSHHWIRYSILDTTLQ